MLRNPESIFRTIEILRSFKFLPLNNLQTRPIHGSTRPPLQKAPLPPSVCVVHIELMLV